MQELKAIRGGDIHDLVEFGDGSEIYHDETLYYLKNVADEALDEKDAEIRRLKRALYKACANWAHEKDDRYYLKYVCISDDARIQYERWRKMERKCRAKAEEYK